MSYGDFYFVCTSWVEDDNSLLSVWRFSNKCL